MTEQRGGGSMLLVRRLFLILLGITAGIAFGSLHVQAMGLFGSGGILPGCDFLERAHERAGARAVWQLPGLFWLHCSDAAIHGACAAGLALSLLLAAGVAPSLCAGLLWLLYLSLSGLAGPFLGYQWDILLLESLFLAVFLAPRQWRPRDAWRTPVPRSVVFLHRWLLFRLFFLSGALKLLSGDPAWASLTALEYHYFTQPLPAWTSWYVHHLPSGFHQVSALGMFAIELGAPLAVFAPRRARQIAAAAMASLQLGIAFTGNYGFFNLLTLALCLLLLDDAALRRAVPARWRGRLPGATPQALPAPRRGARAAYAALLAVVLFLTGLSFAHALGGRPEPPAPLRAAAPLRSFNAYGLFTVMTTERPEILLEGSRDGRHWLTYGFRWKPGPLDRAPRFVQPHMPRLDWQMWFAALRRCEPWFQRLLARLLEGAPAVSDLLAHDPFADAPPRYLRSTVFRYRFADPGRGRWWNREPSGRPYCATVMLRDGRLERADF